MFQHKVFCLMNSGKPLTEEVADVLLFNAYDMFYAGRDRQRVKGRRYDGVIETNLESLTYVGMSCMEFQAEIAIDNVGMTKVRFLVRTSDLNGLEQGEWAQLVAVAYGPKREIPKPNKTKNSGLKKHELN